jgi:hypothetical protein
MLKLLSYRYSNKAILWILLIISVLILILLSPNLFNSSNMLSDDFARFWASGNLNFHGQNPYTPVDAELPHVNIDDLLSGHNFIILEPPWSISIFMPFGLIDYPISRLFWMIASILLILISALMLWQIYSGDVKKRWLVLLVSFIFAPTISALGKGQISGLVLLGISGFLYFTEVKINDWIAGAFLGLASIKAQLVVLFWIALFLWIIQQRRWIIFIAASLTFLVMLAFSVVFNPLIIEQYIGLLKLNYVYEWALPTIGSYLRLYWLGVDRYWVQFLPLVLGIVWIVIYWVRHRTTWNWPAEMPLILLVSMVVTPYMWTYDVVVLIPAVILAALSISTDWKRLPSVLLILMFITLNALDLILHVKLFDFWFVWLVPSLFIWYLVIQKLYPIHYPLSQVSITNTR